MLTSHVKRMFPISFARRDIYGARSLSESNLVSWLQHFSPDSATPHTFMITESIPNTFGLPSSSSSDMNVEFIIGGYYVKLSDRYFTDEITSFNTEGERITSYYAYIKFKLDGDNECFSTLDGGEEASLTESGATNFTALKIAKVIDTDAIPEDTEGADYVIHLFDLKQKNVISDDTLVSELEYIIPRTSFRTIDGGEI